jgi:hypothetical protein
MLDEELYSQVGQENLSNASGADLLTKGIYKYVRYFSYYGGNNWVMSTESNSDDFYCSWGGFDATSWGGAQNFLNMDAGHSMAQTNWDDVYEIIAQCNEVINNYSSSDDATTKVYVAEARFWRGFSYDRLYRLFGTVPLVTGNEDLSNGLARASDDEMKSFIIADYEAAYEALPETRSTSESGRPSKYAVAAAMARYYLNNKDWANAAKYAKEVIDSGQFSLESNYQDIFSNDNNSETILAIDNISESQLGNKYVALVLEASLRAYLGLSGISSSNGYGMATQFYKSFDPNDVRITPYDKTTKQGIAVTGILYNDDGTSVYSQNDQAISVEEYLHRVPTFKWPVQEDIPNGEDASYDFPLLRLGEVYLTYAEALNEEGQTAEAATYVNLIRARAGVASISTSLSQSEMRDAILDERGWETYHEGYRREDLVRNGKLLEKVNEKYEFYFGEEMPWKSEDYRILEAIPTNALMLNPLLEQNPGYAD